MSLMLQHRPDFAGPRPKTAFGNTIYAARVTSPGPGKDEKWINVQLAESDEDREQAQSLINRMYQWRGYGSSHTIPASDTHSTFLAALDEAVVGTITLAVDSPRGLAADAIFKDEIDAYRRMPGASVCELTKFAFDAEMPSKQLLASLFHIVFIYGQRRHRCTDLFIEVNPRHRRFYETMLGFKAIGSLKTNPSVDAPAQLMWLKVADIATHINDNNSGARATNTNCRSLYPLFLSRSDERNVLAHLSRSGLGQHTLDMQAYFARG